MPPPTLYTRRRRAPSPYPQYFSASSTSSATSISQSRQSSVRSFPSAPPSTPTSDALQPTSTTRPSRAAHHTRPPPAVPFYPDIRRRLRYRNNALALNIAAQKNYLIQRLLLYCPRLSSDLCSILCTCENTLEPDNPWLSASWIPLEDTDYKSAVHYVPSPNHSHTWVMRPDGLKEAAEVLEAVMNYDMPNSIHQQFTEAAHTLAQIYQGLQAEMQLYSGRNGAGRELSTKWVISWNMSEQDEREWKEVKYRQILKDREDVQAGRRHVMQTTGMTEEEIVQRVRTPSRKKGRSSSSTVVPTMEVAEHPNTSAPPIRAYYQRPGFANRSGVAADWLSEVPIPIETGPTAAPAEAQRTRTTADSTALMANEGWVSAEDAARAAAIQYTLQQESGAPRMIFAQWVQFAHSSRPGPMTASAQVPLAHPNHNQGQMNVWAHPPAPSQGIQIFSGQAITATNGQPSQVTELTDGTTPPPAQRLTARFPPQVWSFGPSLDAAGGASLERSASAIPLFPVGSAAPAAPIAPNSAIPSERQELRARTVSLVNRGTNRRTRNGRSSIAGNRDVELSEWARPGSQTMADDATIRERNAPAAAHDDNGNHSTASPDVISSNAAFHYEVQDGRAAAAATIRAVDNMRRARVANSAQQDQARAYHALIRERNAALRNIHRANSRAATGATPPSTFASSEEQTGIASTAAGTNNMAWQPQPPLAASPQPRLARPDDSAVQSGDTALLERYRAVLAEEEQVMRSEGRTLLESRADRRRENRQRTPP